MGWSTDTVTKSSDFPPFLSKGILEIKSATKYWRFH